jgi:hypothetical protein
MKSSTLLALNMLLAPLVVLADVQKANEYKTNDW